LSQDYPLMDMILTHIKGELCGRNVVIGGVACSLPPTEAAFVANRLPNVSSLVLSFHSRHSPGHRNFAPATAQSVCQLQELRELALYVLPSTSTEAEEMARMVRAMPRLQTFRINIGALDHLVAALQASAELCQAMAAIRTVGIDFWRLRVPGFSLPDDEIFEKFESLSVLPNVRKIVLRSHSMVLVLDLETHKISRQNYRQVPVDAVRLFDTRGG
jgi:hypothetical protein